jgi:uroporphyrin-III C-methyltransferase/precorrin-2 dehydrogenase/sirohydrochlorin ferrochelatase
VAVIEAGTRPEQKVSTGILAELGSLAARHEGGPALLVIGDVVRHAAAWAPPELALMAAW